MAVEMRTIGDMTLPVVGVGCWSFGSAEGEYWGNRDQETTNEIVAAALELNPSTFFDTAEAYQDGRSESALATALKASGDAASKAIVATKILPTNCTTPEKVREHLEASLKRLGAESVDLYQVHWPLADADVAPAFAELAKLQAEGKIKHIGVSNFGVKQLTAALATGVKIATNQLCYNLLSRAIEFEVMDLCAKNKIGIICYSPLLQGLLTDKGVALTSFDSVDKMRLRTYHFDGKREHSRHGGPGHEALMLETLAKIKKIAKDAGLSVPVLATSWCLMNPAVISVIPGASSRKQLESNMSAAKPLPAAVKAALDDATDALKQAIGPQLDIYQSPADQRSF
eukprot:m.177519 g.177519  ORF g.177519 m.177519 type:complete len:342 (+) comp14365_c0_seq1:54-1079(+)